ncbi:YwbE family protein [Aliarcobacter butzleri]|uniref:YwbE family protein n=1 Tax=Aliarcobacter butzleri TaxID=28197 RepID=A0AAW6VHR2_9BACT|nr:YwbE family protein [Aliarcobacter butzleri]MCG3664543.1 YwbE family protein [Aliarcobacter butzleri]MCG3679424.1 YwbE family protein [Aliarcobacter butzleri]MCG3718251.1 YwbE family protein [Aliarcobacter butzleri]MCT7561158.1 YwbE family protein [Aliarcobacter butzleri]MCT7590516.1 YwbE family protein [Aliarcobacter butzleri]
MLDNKKRINIKAGLKVNIVLKQDQRTGKLTSGIVKNILTNSPTHPHGIKVRLQDGQVGRVQEIL